jgi:hypothetical protein
MARTSKPRRESRHTTLPDGPRGLGSQILEPPQSSVLDLVDALLNKGVMANGELTLGVAGIDLIYLRLSALLAAADRVLPPDPARPPRRRRHR